MDRTRRWIAALAFAALACGDPTGPEALEKSTFRAELEGAMERTLSGNASFSEALALFPDTVSQDVWLLSLTANRPGGRTEIRLLGGTEMPEEASYGIVPFDPPLAADRAFGYVAVFEGDSVTGAFEASSGRVRMTRVTGMEGYGTFRFDADRGDSLQISASGEFRGYH